jgi:uncharacterized RDD family membrane protein YckC/RNA polymerase subunit RPABC4/transcription elongation factor Spt4
MYCSNCGQAVMEGARFCAGCGAAAQVAVPATLFCASCGTSIPEAGQFCPSCGQPSVRTPGYGPVAKPLAGIRYGGFWQRFFARLLDGLITAALAMIPAIIVGVIVHNAVYPSDQLFVSDTEAANAVEAGFWGGYGVYLLVVLLYWLVGWSVGGTLGQRAVGLRLVKVSTGGAPGFGSTLVRVIVASVCSVSLLGLVGYLWMVGDDKKQTWHDKAAGTVVVARN